MANSLTISGLTLGGGLSNKITVFGEDNTIITGYIYGNNTMNYTHVSNQNVTLSSMAVGELTNIYYYMTAVSSGSGTDTYELKLPSGGRYCVVHMEGYYDSNSNYQPAPTYSYCLSGGILYRSPQYSNSDPVVGTFYSGGSPLSSITVWRESPNAQHYYRATILKVSA